MCGPVWQIVSFAPNQALPDGYEVGAEWGDIGEEKPGIGCYYWAIPKTDEHGEPRRTRWEARRDAIEHARQNGARA